MKRFNGPLIAGFIIFAAILIVIIFPQRLTSINPYGIENVRVEVVPNQGIVKMEGAPFKPSKESPLGTDELGRDVLSLIIYGTRLTMLLGLLIVVGRFLIALPIGIGAGFGSHFCNALINQFNAMFSAIPALIISIIILKMGVFSSLYKRESIIAFVIVLTFVGWGRLGLLIMERVRDILSKPFIKGEIAVGKGSFQIAMENVIPHLSPELVVLFFMEMAMALSMVMQLGIFGVFIGNVSLMEDVGKPMNINFEPEWGSMLSTGRVYISSAPWVVLSPAVAFFISILGSNLLGEGIRRMLQEKNSKFIVRVRKVLSLNRGYTINKKFILRAAAGAMAILLIIFTFEFRGKGSVFTLKNQSKLDGKLSFEQVVSGSKDAEITAQEIAKELKEIGFNPLKDEDYISNYSLENSKIVLESSINITKAGSSKELSQGEDYLLSGYGSYTAEGEILDFRREDVFRVGDFDFLRNKFLLLDDRNISEETLNFIYKKAVLDNGARGIILSFENKGFNRERLKGREINGTILYIKDELVGKDSANGVLVKAILKSQGMSGTGRNVFGILEGLDPKLGNQAVIIGVNYNYTKEDRGDAILRVKTALELGRRLKEDGGNKNRSVILAFFDGNTGDNFSGIRNYTKNTPYSPDKTALYIDLTKLQNKNGEGLYYSNDKAPVTRYFAWAFNRQLEENFKEKDIKLKRVREVRNIDEIMKSPREQDLMYYITGIPTIVIGEDRKSEKGDFTMEDIGEIIYRTMIKNTY